MRAADLEGLLAKALGVLDLHVRVHDALAASSHATPVRVVAIGKGAPAMASGAIARWRGDIERCLVVAPDATDIAGLQRVAERAGVADRLTILRAAHPLPDARSVRAAERCLSLVHTEERRRILVLVSGGASSLVCAPSAGITLPTKRAITSAMLASGAAVQEINLVRKHLSRIKGGGLLRAAATNDVLTIVASDVIGGTATDVGSGPSVPDMAATAAARRALRRFAPPYADVPLAPTFAGSSRGKQPRRARVVASPEALAHAYARLLRARGVAVRVLPPSQASALELAEEYVARARRSLRPGALRGTHAFIRAAEPSVVVPARAGKGGRSTHLAALVGLALVGADVPRVRFAALASDGVDGGSGCGGAIIDDRFAKLVTQRLGPMALAHAIALFDTGSLHRAIGSAVVARPTGHNLGDLHVLIVR